FLTGLKSRGLCGVILVISDQHAGLLVALRRSFQGAAHQRCRVHFARNLLALVPKSHKDMVAAVFRTIFAQPDADAATSAKFLWPSSIPSAKKNPSPPSSAANRAPRTQPQGPPPSAALSIGRAAALASCSAIVAEFPASAVAVPPAPQPLGAIGPVWLACGTAAPLENFRSFVQFPAEASIRARPITHACHP